MRAWQEIVKYVQARRSLGSNLLERDAELTLDMAGTCAAGCTALAACSLCLFLLSLARFCQHGRLNAFSAAVRTTITSVTSIVVFSESSKWV